MTDNQRHVKIGVYLICKNEKDFIERCYETIKEADAIVICDTGSTDGTPELMLNKQRMDRPSLIVKNISVSPWRFDDARNTAMMLLPNDIDVCVSIDADELMESGWYQLLKSEVEKDIAEKGKPFDRYHHRFKTIWDWDKGGINVSEHWHERIHTRHGYMWKLPVHEHIVKCDGTREEIKWLKDLQMTQKPDTTKNRGSYLQMLKQSAKEDKKRWKTFSFLAGEYINAGFYQEAVEAIEHALKLPDSDKAFLYYQLSSINKRQKDYDAAISNMMNVCKNAPHVREYIVYLAQTYVEANRQSDAVAAIDRATKITERTFGYEYNSACWGDRFNQLAMSIKESK